MSRNRAQEGAEAAGDGQARPLRYVNPNYVITGVPARDLTADEARRFGPLIEAAQAAAGVLIYGEVEA